jgi:hypothetical protein
MEGNRVTQIIGVKRIAPETPDFCEVGNLVKKKQTWQFRKFPCHKIEKKNHDAGHGHYVVDGH